MPKLPNKMPEEFNARAPTEPHLAVMEMYEGVRPVFVALPMLGVVAIVENPSDPARGIFPLAIVRVSHKRLEFRCPCGQKACTRRVVFKGTWTGLHPYGTDQISVQK